MPGTCGATQNAAQRWHLNTRAQCPPARVNRRVIRQEEQINAHRFEQGLILLRCAWIGAEIFSGAELQGVHVDARHDRIGVVTRLLHEMLVTGVQIAQGRHESDAFARGAQTCDFMLQLGNGFGDDHVGIL